MDDFIRKLARKPLGGWMIQAHDHWKEFRPRMFQEYLEAGILELVQECLTTTILPHKQPHGNAAFAEHLQLLGALTGRRARRPNPK